MTKKQTKPKQGPTTKQRQSAKGLPFKNVALFVDDHAKLKKLADADDRTMARQLSVILRLEHDRVFEGQN